MGALYDQIIDEAEEAAKQSVLYDPTEWDICDLVGEIVGVNITPFTTGGKLAIAAYYKDAAMVKFYHPVTGHRVMT